MRLSVFSVIVFCFIGSSAFAQIRIGTGAVDGLYQMHCAACHGKELEGGLGGSLLSTEEWKLVGHTTSFVEYVKNGNLEMGMPPYENILKDSEIRSLEIYIAEKRQLAGSKKTKKSNTSESLIETELHSFSVETVVEGLKLPWSSCFLPEGGLLVTERGGALRMYDRGRLSDPIAGTPEVWVRGQGGMLEVALHPEYERNGWVYLAYTQTLGENVGDTKIVRGRISHDKWVDEELIFETPEKFHRKNGVHFGTRLVFQDGYLFFGIGDRGAQNMAQDLSTPNGKIHRIFDDGRIPKDNPFINQPDAYPTIWSYGHRNPQGLVLNPADNRLWESEHGPRGGDEVNVVAKGKNYGWPEITFGMNYNGTPITDKTAKEGMEQPKHHWTPSIAVCGIDFYTGDEFPKWSGNLFAGGLASRELHRLTIEDDKVVDVEVILKGLGLVRDVANGPDGHLYVVLNSPGRIVKLVPRK